MFESSQVSCTIFPFQAPRPLSQIDLEKVLTKSRKTRVAATEYTTLSSQSPGWSRNRDSNDYQVQAAISEISRLVVSQFMNIQSESDAQDPWNFSSVPKLQWGNTLFCNILLNNILFSFLSNLSLDIQQIEYIDVLGDQLVALIILEPLDINVAELLECMSLELTLRSLG